MNIEVLVKITSRAWALPILAALHQGCPGRQAALLNATGASRGGFGQSLEHLIELGLVERNPGHGHPLRPEFRLTKAGARAAAMADRIHSLTPDTDHALLRRNWTLPVLGALQGPRLFSQIKTQLPRITDRALSQSLHRLEDHNWIARRIAEGRPPRPMYSVTGPGKIIAQTLLER